MIKVEHIETWGFEHAIRGMRNPLNSWDKSDSHWRETPTNLYNMIGQRYYAIGDNDLQLMQTLYKAGPEHRKYLRQIFISMDIIAPLYFYKEMDQYKIGVTTDSCSTMHTIHKKDFELGDFSHDHLTNESIVDDFQIKSSFDVLYSIIDMLNALRFRYNITQDKKYWYQIIQLLPSSYNQKRTITMSYENAVNIIHQRENHKLDEWRDFVDILMELPYMEDILYDFEQG